MTDFTFRDVPARRLPIPATVSPEIRKLIAQPLNPGWNTPPTTPEGWKNLAATQAAVTAGTLPDLCRRLGVTFAPGQTGGTRTFTVTPNQIPPENAGRLLVHIHGGCYALNPGQAGLPEALMMAGFGKFRVISIDYRMPPEAYFPAALDDIMAVWKTLLETNRPGQMAVFGSSAGGALTLAMVLRARQEGLPLPAAIAPGTPMADVTGAGDSFLTNALVDNVLVAPDGFCAAATRFYANGHDLDDPMLSPLLGDMTGFPPAILTTGTRDLLLSNTVRTHRKLRQAGVDAALHVYEGQAHAQFYRDDTAPETREAFMEISAFFDRYLTREA